MSDYTRCKSFGHQWDDAPAPPNTRAPDRNHGQLHFRCVQCYMVKRVIVNLYTGETRNSYTKPDDYDVVKDTRRQWKINYTLSKRPKTRKRKRP